MLERWVCLWESRTPTQCTKRCQKRLEVLSPLHIYMDILDSHAKRYKKGGMKYTVHVGVQDSHALKGVEKMLEK